MKNIIATITLLLVSLTTWAQNTNNEHTTIKLNLNEAIDVAFRQSIYSFRQKHMYLGRYWEFRSYQASNRPTLSLKTTPLNYQHSIKSRFIDGEDVLVPNHTLISDAKLDISQNITLTGATISAESTFMRIQNQESNNSSYSSKPISIRLSQPLNGYNRFKWLSRIEPLKFEQAKREYLQSLQDLSRQTTNVFFNLIKAKINIEIAETNLSNADTLYNIGKGRFEIGTVTQDELLDLELSFLNANLSLSKAKVNLEQARSYLNSFLGFEDHVKIDCEIPSSIPSFKVKVDNALTKAYENNPRLLNFKQQLLQADRDIAQARGQNGINASIMANLGINKSSNDFNNIYQSPFENDQGVSLTLGVPIVDWGLKKGKVQMAKSQKNVVEATVRQEKNDFEQDIFIQVMEFNMQEQQVKIAAKADTIALKGFEVTKQRFLIDKVDVIKLNAARSSLNAAQRNYIQSIQDYWTSYFNIRKLTLFDFETDIPLIEELDHLLQNQN